MPLLTATGNNEDTVLLADDFALVGTRPAIGVGRTPKCWMGSCPHRLCKKVAFAVS